MQSLTPLLGTLPLYEELEKQMLKQEQAECPVVHRFAPGLCFREVTMPAGALVIGHEHTTRHANIMLKGKGTLLVDGKLMHVEAPFFYVAEPGRKVAYWEEETVWQNIFPTESQDVEEIEDAFLVKSPAFLEAIRGIEQIQRIEDRIDFAQFLEEYNLEAQWVREQSEATDDATSLPSGSYKFQVGPSEIEGKGLRATADIREGEDIVVASIAGKRTVAGRFTNHAKEPNAVMVFLESGVDELAGVPVVVLRALKDIKGNRGGMLGEEITTDYRNNIEAMTCLLLHQPSSEA